MNDLLGQLQIYAVALWRKRWYIVPVAWVLCVAGWLTVMSLPDKFISSARIYVDTDSLLSPLLRGISVEGNVVQQVDYMQRTLLSRPNLEKLMRMADLDLTVRTPKEKDDLLDEMVKRTSIQAQGQGKNLFTVSFVDTRPEVSQRVVQSLLSIFVESNIGASRTDLEKARQFLDQQIAEYERQLQTAEAKLASFKRQNLDYVAGPAAAGASYAQRFDQLRGQRAEVKGMLDEAISRRDSLQRDLGATPQQLEVSAAPTVFIQPSGAAGYGLTPAIAAVQARIDEQEKALDQLRSRFTPQHPDVIAANRTLDSLRQQLEAEKADAASKPAKKNAPTDRKIQQPNPLYDQIKIRLVDMSSNVETLQRKLAQIDVELTRLEKMANSAPAVEAELSTLNRDYGIIKKNYDELIQRREAARIADAVETRGEKIQFRVVDPPQVPLSPSGPPRLLLMSAVLIGAIAAGFAAAFLIAQLDDSFMSMTRLRRDVAGPVRGSVSRVLSAAERRRRLVSTVSFACSLAALIVVYGYLAAVVLRIKLPIS